TGQTLGAQLGVAEETRAALIGPVEQAAVGPFEIEQQGNRLAHPYILEVGLAQVEDKALHAPGIQVGDLFPDDASVAERRAVIAGAPVLGAELLVEIELAGLEGLQGHTQIPVVVDDDAIEIVEAAAD